MNMRKIIAVLAAVLLLCAAIPMAALSVSAAATVNSDFEDGTVGGWTTSSGTALAIVAAADLPVANPNGGNYALYFESTNYSYVNYKMTVKANTTYKISVDVLSASDRNPVNIRMRTTSSSDAATQSYTPVIDAWTTYTYTFDSGSNTTLNFRMQAGWSTSKFYFDNISCVEYIEPESPVLPEGTIFFDGFEGDTSAWKSNAGTLEVIDAASAPAQKATNGYKVMKHTIPSDTYPYVAYGNAITVEPNTDYIISADLLNSSTNWPVQILVGTNSWFGTVLGQSPSQQIKPATTAWETHSFVFNSGNNTKIYIGFKSQWANTTIYADNFYIAPLGTVTNDGYMMNGDFETGTGLAWLHTTATEIIADPTGASGYVISTNEAGSGVHMFSQYVQNMIVGEQYELNFKVYGLSTASNSAFWIKFPSAFTTWTVTSALGSASYNAYTPRINVNSLTGSWQDVKITFTAQAAGAVIDFMNYRASEGKYYFDDISITHVHTPGAAATCENAQVCTVCNVELAPALGHSYNEGICGNCGAADPNYVPPHTCEFVGVETKAPSCTEDGIMTYSCECGEGTYTESIPALGHTAGAAADCENAQVCTVCGAELTAALGHNYNAEVTAPDCVNGGYTTYTCACGDSYVADETAALGHTAGAAADCTNAQVCTVCGAELTAALGHSYNAEVTAPDCVNGGYTTYTCACGDSYVADETAALGHSYEADVTAPTCTAGGYTTYTCACGDSYVADQTAALGHNYEAAETKAPTCGETGVMTYTCACGDSYTEEIPATGAHEYFNDCDTVCMNCYQETREASHNVNHVEAVAPTCNAMGNIEYWYCDACGQAWLDAQCMMNTNRFAVILPMAEEHTYDNEFDVDCNVCGAERAVANPGTYIGMSASEDVIGLAVKYDVAVEGFAVKAGTFVQADYTNATYNGYKLIELGVEASNGISSTTIKGERMFDLEADKASFAFRVVNIPEGKENVEITFTPYYIVEIDGEQVTLYGEAVSGTYATYIG